MMNEFHFNLMLGRMDHAKSLRLQGLNADVDSGSVPEDIWQGGGAYAGQPTTGDAETVTVDSASNSDEGAVVRVLGLDANYAPLTEDVTLNATGTGVTTGTFRRVYQLDLVTPATGQASNVGAITANHTTTTANVFAIMPVGSGRAQGCVYTVPAGHTAYVAAITGQVESASAGGARLALWTRKQNGAVVVSDRLAISNSAPASLRPPVPFAIPALTDIRLRALAVNGDDTAISASLDIILVGY